MNSGKLFMNFHHSAANIHKLATFPSMTAQPLASMLINRNFLKYDKDLLEVVLHLKFLII